MTSPGGRAFERDELRDLGFTAAAGSVTMSPRVQPADPGVLAEKCPRRPRGRIVCPGHTEEKLYFPLAQVREPRERIEVGRELVVDPPRAA